MTIRRTQPICWWCKHFEPDILAVHQAYQCGAFDTQIPAAIIDGTYDHREPHPNDNGLQFEAEAPHMLTSREVFNRTTPTAIETALYDALMLLEMGRALGGVQPPLEE